MNKQIIDDAIKALFNREKKWSCGALKQVNYKGGRFQQFDIPVERGNVILIKYYIHDIAVWVAPERSVDSLVREFRVEEVSNLLRSDEV